MGWRAITYLTQLDAPVVVGAVCDHCCPRQFGSRGAGLELIRYFHEFLANWKTGLRHWKGLAVQDQIDPKAIVWALEIVEAFQRDR